MAQYPLAQYKPVQDFLTVVKGKYKIPILIYLKGGEKRYYQLKQKFKFCSERILIKQLQELERDQVISKSISGRKAPFKTSYRISSHGFTLCSILSDMWNWGKTHTEKF